MNEKLIEISESIARIETALDFILKRLDEIEKQVESDHATIISARSVFRAAIVIASIFGSASAVAVEMFWRR